MALFVSTLLYTITAVICSGADSGFFTDVHWTTSIKLSEYDGYRSATLLSYTIPDQTTQTTISLQAQSSSKACQYKEVHVYFQHGSFPLISPYNETYPPHIYKNRTDLVHLVVLDNGVVTQLGMSRPRAGSWYFAAFLPRPSSSKHLKVKGLAAKKCSYGMFVVVDSKGLDHIEELSLSQHHHLSIDGKPHSSPMFYRYSIPKTVSFYSILLSNCVVSNSPNTSYCPLHISVASNRFPSMNSTSKHCDNTTTCQIDVESPMVGKWTYLAVVLDKDVNISTKVTFDLEFHVINCDILPFIIPQTEFTYIDSGTVTSEISYDSCEQIEALGRFSLSDEAFNISFLFPEFGGPFPAFKPIIEGLIPDQKVLVTHFTIEAGQDIGGTLKIQLEMLNKTYVAANQTAVVHLCVMKDSIPSGHNVHTCDDGIALIVNFTTKDTDQIYIPYPEAGLWFIAFNSQCFSNDTGAIEVCYQYPSVRLSVAISSCVDSQCGEYGVCKEYISGVHVFSTCQCFAGWRGFGCTDGSEALSWDSELLALLLLTLSNLFFIPAICLSAYRRFYVEALVYFFTMFFSGFYHACDASNLVYYCMTTYDLLSYGDYLGSILSFWMTVIAMAELHRPVRAICHMVGVLLVAMAVEVDRHALWVFVVPVALSSFICLASWVWQCKKRRKLYPEKRQYLTRLLPGALLAGTGLFIFAYLETDANYRYTHSVWHTVIALCIVFLLPKRMAKKGTRSPTDNTHGRIMLDSYNGHANGAAFTNDSDMSSNDNGESFDNPTFIAR